MGSNVSIKYVLLKYLAIYLKVKCHDLDNFIVKNLFFI